MQRAVGDAFPHRHNTDGSYDAICPKCYATVATEAVEGRLRLRELAHVCDPMQADQGRHAEVPQTSLRCTK